MIYEFTYETPGEQSTAKGSGRNHLNMKVSGGVHNPRLPVFDIETERRKLHLDRRDRVDFVCANKIVL